jgi:hypothetical protein
MHCSPALSGACGGLYWCSLRHSLALPFRRIVHSTALLMKVASLHHQVTTWTHSGFGKEMAPDAAPRWVPIVVSRQWERSFWLVVAQLDPIDIILPFLQVRELSEPTVSRRFLYIHQMLPARPIEDTSFLDCSLAVVLLRNLHPRCDVRILCPPVCARHLF